VARKSIRLEDIAIRTDPHARDMGRVIQLHGSLYQQEYGYGLAFESYVSAGLYEFLQHYDPDRSRLWLCEHAGSLVGCLCLMDRGESAQLRFFLIHPRCRGLGLGRLLLDECFAFMQARGYRSAYLWTTHELTAAAHLYADYGFQIAEEKASTSFGKTVVEQKYVKVLDWTTAGEPG
jgi:ribosomal protein S18 acetylase RimI-like enzyme